MRANLELTGGLPMTEAVASRLDRPDAKAIVGEVALGAAQSGQSLREALMADSRIELSEDEIEGALDPAAYLGSAEAFVDRALEAHGRRGDGG
jgi:3-carboxy-cis,cis-muconate cycloisomerase